MTIVYIFLQNQQLIKKNAKLNKAVLNFSGSLPAWNISKAPSSKPHVTYVPIFQTQKEEQIIAKTLSMLNEMESDYTLYEPSLTYIADGTDLPLIKKKFIPVMEQFLGIRNLTSDEYIISVIIGKGCDNAKDLHCDLGADAVMLLALNGPSTLHTSSRQSQKIHATKAKYCLSTDKYVKYYPYTLKSLTETPWGHALIMTGGKHGSGGLYHIPPLICENNPDRKFITLVVKKK